MFSYFVVTYIIFQAWRFCFVFDFIQVNSTGSCKEVCLEMKVDETEYVAMYHHEKYVISASKKWQGAYIWERRK